MFFVRGVFLGHSRAHLGPGVHHIHEVAAGIGPQDGLQHLFVLQAASAEARQRLAAAADGGVIFLGVVRQSRKSASAPELGAPHDDGRRGGLRHEQVGGVRVAHLVVLVDGGEFPQGVGESHSAVISLGVQKVPFLPPLRLVDVGFIGEAVQLLAALWLGETLQGQVDIVALPLPGDDEVKDLEVLAADEQRASRGRGGLHLHAEHQTVKHPGFIAHSSLVLHKDGVRGRQVEGAHPTSSGGDSVKQPDVLHLQPEEEEEDRPSSSNTRVLTAVINKHSG